MADQISKVIGIAVCDPHPVIRVGVRTSLQNQADMCVVAECISLTELLTTRSDHLPDIALVGINTFLSTNDLMHELLAVSDNTKVILFCEPVHVASQLDHEWLLQAGVKGVILKEQPLEVLPRAIRVIQDGGLWFRRSVTETVLTSMIQTRNNGASRGSRGELLTEREKRIINLICDGKSNKQIANEINLSQATVASDLTRIYKKMRTSDRTQLLLMLQKEPHRLFP